MTGKKILKTLFDPSRWLGFSTVLLLISITLGSFYFVEHSKVKQELKSERLNSEALLSRNIQLQKGLKKIERENEKLSYANKIMNEDLVELRSQHNSLKIQYQHSTQNLRKLQNEVNHFSDQQNAMLITEKNLLNQIASEKLIAQKYLNDLKQLESENKHVKVEYVPENKGKAYHFFLQTYNSKRKSTTTKAKKTKHMMLRFTLPDGFSKNQIKLIVSGPSPDNQSKTDDDIDKISYPITSMDLTLNESIKQEAWINLDKNLHPGIYLVDLYSDGYHLGGAQILLK